MSHAFNVHDSWHASAGSYVFFKNSAICFDV